MRHYFFENVRFCPKCGVQSLLRDVDRVGSVKELKQLNDGTEWWCTTCGFSFAISKSHKWHVADELHRRDRQVRVGKPSDQTNPAIRDAFVKFLEKNGEHQEAPSESATQTAGQSEDAEPACSP